MKIVIKTCLLFASYTIISCNQTSTIHIAKTSAEMHKEVLLMMDSVKKNIAITPGKWMNYFEDTSLFYMASEGKLVFQSYNAAQKFITDTLVHYISTVNLIWKNIHADSIAENTVAINTAYHEDLTAESGNIMHEDGYCTAIADNTNAGWKFRNLHWSISK
jgi:hypothetical protein